MAESGDVRPVALVTGANRGIGFEVARQLARLGMTVVIGAREAAKGEAAAGELTSEGLDARAIVLDVADGASVGRMATEIGSEFGRLDVLVKTPPPSRTGPRRRRGRTSRAPGPCSTSTCSAPGA